MKRRDLVRHLELMGCALSRDGGRQSWWQHQESGKRSAVPRHREIDDQLVRKICKDLGIEAPR
ncbi:MAG: type II toxin-antitoxin system HicA family toxin [Gammaproteobacteria bacterium]|nr:type II toxin-antitoxin system HicA family toxin [Gammaproteobacteria bacterium]